MRLLPWLFSSMSVSLLVAACSGGTGPAPAGGVGASGGGGTFSASGKADAPAPPSGAKVAVVWVVSSGSPDYAYAFGAGSTSGDGFSVSFDTAPPSDALNVGKLGVGLVTVFDPAATVPNGKLGKAELDGAVAISAQYAIIYRATSEGVVKNGWDAAFPQGFACGKCVPKQGDATFDTFAPVDCSEVKVVPMSTDPRICNWT